MSGKAGTLPNIFWLGTHPNGRRPRNISVKGDTAVWRAHTPVAAVTVAGGQVASCQWPG
jgi:hypothetical protein